MTEFRRMDDSWRATTARFHAGNEQRFEFNGTSDGGCCRFLDDYPRQGVFPRRGFLVSIAIHRGNTEICTVASLRRSRSRQTNRDSI